MFARFLPRPRPRLFDRTFLTSRPLGSTATQQAAASRLLRAGPPASAASVLNASGVCRWQAPSRDLEGLRPRSPYRRSPSHVPCKNRRPGSRRLHAGHRLANHRDTRQAHHGRTARPPAFDATSITLTTLHQRTPTPVSPEWALSGTSSWSPPDASSAPSPCRSPRRSSANAAQGGLTPPPEGRRRRANKPPSLAQHRLYEDRLHQSPFSVRDTRLSRKSGCCPGGLRRFRAWGSGSSRVIASSRS
jgi:hypothetical protein